jgi:hypothetical protein
MRKIPGGYWQSIVRSTGLDNAKSFSSNHHKIPLP